VTENGSVRIAPFCEAAPPAGGRPTPGELGRDVSHHDGETRPPSSAPSYCARQIPVSAAVSPGRARGADAPIWPRDAGSAGEESRRHIMNLREQERASGTLAGELRHAGWVPI
jgi:hypothetical protein